MHSGDHRHGDFPPDIGRLLRPVGAGRGAGRIHQPVAAPPLARRHLGEVAHVEPGAEAAAFAGQNDGAQARHGLERLARVHQRLEHGVVERVHLVGAGQADVGDAPFEGDGNAVGHGGVVPCCKLCPS